MADAAVSRPDASRTAFLHNVLWGWTGVAVNLIIGILLAPIIVKKLGVEQYGVWVRLFSLLDSCRHNSKSTFASRTQPFDRDTRCVPRPRLLTRSLKTTPTSN